MPPFYLCEDIAPASPSLFCIVSPPCWIIPINRKTCYNFCLKINLLSACSYPARAKLLGVVFIHCLQFFFSLDPSQMLFLPICFRTSSCQVSADLPGVRSSGRPAERHTAAVSAQSILLSPGSTFCAWVLGQHRACCQLADCSHSVFLCWFFVCPTSNPWDVPFSFLCICTCGVMGSTLISCFHYGS